MKNRELTKEELNELVGGALSVEHLDVNNLNQTFGCVCTYNNRPQAITNTNEVSGCKCECWPN